MSKKSVKKKAKRKPVTALVRQQPQDLSRPDDQPGVMGVFQRMARDPNMTVEKLERLADLQMKLMAVQAKADFETAFRAMSNELPRIARNGKILNSHKEVQSRFSKFEDIRAAVDPILAKFGFSPVTYETSWPETGTMEIVGALTHQGGHTKVSRFRSTADASGGKNAIQGLGSATQYGRRYTLIDLLSIVCEGQDDDGVKAGKAEKKAQEKPPAGPQTRQESSAAMHDGNGDTPITTPQMKRLFAILHTSGRDEASVKMWLVRRGFAQSSWKQITQKDYDTVWKAIEAPGDLPEGGREPGAEG